MAAPSPTTITTHHRLLLPASTAAYHRALVPSAVHLPLCAHSHRAHLAVLAPASIASPSAPAAGSILGKPTVLVAEKLGAASLTLLREFANVDFSYGLSPEELRAKIVLCDALIVRSGTKVGRDVFSVEAARKPPGVRS